MPYFNIVAETSENTVVTEYEPVKKRSDSYQSEAELEQGFIRLLCEQGYEYLPIHTEKDLIANLRKKLEELNNYRFSDTEWEDFFKNAVANPNEHIVEKTRKIQEDNVQVLTRDDGSSKNITLIDKKNIHNNRLQVINQYVIGTEDGANVEIHELVGDDNIFVFGASSDEVIEHYAKADYVSKEFYEKNPAIKAAVDFITSKEVLAVGQKENLERLQHEIISKDWFMTLLDFDAYKEKKEEALEAYADQKAWAKKALINIAKAGYFSSDRTIEEYNQDIWKL